MKPSDPIKQAKQYVLWLLARKDYPRSQLEKKLKARELGPEQIQQLLLELVEAGYYQEDNFKRTRTRQLLKRGLGNYVVKAKLRADRVTIDDGDIEKAYSELGSSAGEELKLLAEKALRRSARSSESDPAKAKMRIVQSLMRKGHRPTDINRVLAALAAEEATYSETS